jgi:hypothetical protein
MDPTIQALLDWLANGTPPPGSYVPTTVEHMLTPDS